MNDNVFDALAPQPQRVVLLGLLDSSPLDVRAESLTGAVAPSADRQRVQILLYHNHLPKLEEYGYIEWDEDVSEVARGPRFDEVRPLLEWVDGPGELNQPEQPGQRLQSSEIDTDLLSDAVDHGYFKSPRQISTRELADAHDISDVDVCKRLHVAIDAALRDYLDRCDPSAATDRK
jgi:hypothetical protein